MCYFFFPFLKSLANHNIHNRSLFTITKTHREYPCQGIHFISFGYHFSTTVRGGGAISGVLAPPSTHSRTPRPCQNSQSFSGGPILLVNIKFRVDCPSLSLSHHRGTIFTFASVDTHLRLTPLF